MIKAGLLHFDGNDSIACEQGTDFDVSITWTNDTDQAVKFKNYTAKMQIRIRTSDTLIYELNTQNGGIVLGDYDGTITLHIPKTITTNLAIGTFKYDLLLIQPQREAIRVIEGNFKITPEVTF